MKSVTTTKPERLIPLYPFTTKEYTVWKKKQQQPLAAWLADASFQAEVGTFLVVPSPDGTIQCVLAGVNNTITLWSLANLSTQLPPHTYHIVADWPKERLAEVALGWELGAYQFSNYKKNTKPLATLYMGHRKEAESVAIAAQAITLARNLINTPANDMGPSALAAACKKVAQEYKAECKIITGDALLKENYPTIHAVGRAAEDAPRLIDIRWGNPEHPKVTLVGKGVCFDSGGLDIKSAGNMKLMKKDMGGAAAVLALAQMVMAHELPVRLRLLIPAVENSVSGNAFRPMDIIKTRKGLTVEIGNTDAEGRLILCDALTEADSESPALIIDCATLTGAARTALGTDIPALFSNNNALAQELQSIALSITDPLWQLPLWKPYGEMLQTPIADLNNAPDSGYAGAITATLFLGHFVRQKTPWVHIDMMAWNTQNRPGRPLGGEAMGVRALFAFLSKRYGKR